MTPTGFYLFNSFDCNIKFVQDILNGIQTTPRSNNKNGKEPKLSRMLHSLKDDTLKSVCQDLGLECDGHKEILTTRIIHHAIADEDGAVRPESTTSDTSSQVLSSFRLFVFNHSCAHF